MFYFQGDRWFFIDDGPYFESLESLVDHHMKRPDGLVDVLKNGVRPGKGADAGTPALNVVTMGAGPRGGEEPFTKLKSQGKPDIQCRAVQFTCVL